MTFSTPAPRSSMLIRSTPLKLFAKMTELLEAPRKWTPSTHWRNVLPQTLNGWQFVTATADPQYPNCDWEDGLLRGGNRVRLVPEKLRAIAPVPAGLSVNSP
jgi:hypothetical protein